MALYVLVSPQGNSIAAGFFQSLNVGILGFFFNPEIRDTHLDDRFRRRFYCGGKLSHIFAVKEFHMNDAIHKAGLVLWVYRHFGPHPGHFGPKTIRT